MTLNKFIKKIIRRFNFYVYKKINGVRFKIPVLSSVGSLNVRTNENWMIQLMKVLLDNRYDTLFVDVGANIGQTLLKVKSIDKSIPYCGFEPNQVCNYYLQELIMANQLRNCTVFPVGLGAEIDIKQLFIFEKGGYFISFRVYHIRSV